MIVPDLAPVKEPPDLTPAQLERLSVLIEELCEAGQAVGKILRHGFESGWNGSNNRRDLNEELGHVFWAMNLLVSKNELNIKDIVESRARKAARETNFLHYQDEE